MRVKFLQVILLTGSVVLMAALSAQFAFAEVYKFTDENGIIHLTNIKPVNQKNVKTYDFPCYASDPKCQQLDWERIPLNRLAFDEEISAASEVYSVDASLIRAIIHAESAYRPEALSPKGAQGLMQLMPGTEKELQVSNVFDPGNNIEGGTRYLSMLLQEFNDDIDLAAAAYNAGPGAVHKYGGIPPYKETKEYVRRINILYRRYRTAGS